MRFRLYRDIWQHRRVESRTAYIYMYTCAYSRYGLSVSYLNLLSENFAVVSLDRFTTKIPSEIMGRCTCTHGQRVRVVLYNASMTTGVESLSPNRSSSIPGPIRRNRNYNASTVRYIVRAAGAARTTQVMTHRYEYRLLVVVSGCCS